MSPKPVAGHARRPTHLVTFCNVGRAAFALIGDQGVVETHAVDMAALGYEAGGTVGAAFHDGHCYIAVQAHPPAVAVFDRAWTQVALFAPDEVKDIHGLAVHAGDLLIVSTGTNQIIALDLVSRAVRPFWSADEVLSDTLHVNDIAAVGGRVVASCFGPPTAAGPRNGTVLDVLTGETLVANLREPHSAALADGAIHVLESPVGDLLRCRTGFSPHRLHGIVGYARGLAIGPATIAIGKSAFRHRSRQGIGDARFAPLTATAAAADAQALSGVFLIDRASGQSRFVDTSAVGDEVYAVAELPITSLPTSRPDRRRLRRTTP